MRISTFFSLVLIFAANLVFAQASIELLTQSNDHTKIKATVDDHVLAPVTTPNGVEYVLTCKSTTPILQVGMPDLPKLTTSIIIPNAEKMQVSKVTYSGYTDYENVSIAPSKGNFTRDISPANVPYIYGEAYNINDFWPGQLAEVREPYILRDFRGQTLVVYPFQYNPVTKVLRVYNDISVSLKPSGIAGLNKKISGRDDARSNADFTEIYKRQFINYGAFQPKYQVVAEYGNMLIISHPDFMEAMQPFVEWKKKCGFDVEIVDVTTIGNASAIKSYVANYYNQHGLNYLLLVGDAPNFVPSSSTWAGDSDNTYAYVEGNDSYPEILVGRFSAETVAHVETMVDRVLRYERYPVADGYWYNNGIGIGSAEGPGDDNEMDFEHVRNIRTDLLAFTYDTVYELYDGSQGDWDKPGDPSSVDFFNLLQKGAGMINYTGHGSSQSCGTTGLSSNDVQQLTNVDRYPFFIAVACVNGEFVGQTCFAEEWLRATHYLTGEPTGAVATFMATINQSWNPPMCAQDEMNDIMTEVHQGNIKRTIGAITMNGCMQMNDEYGSAGDEMTDTWTIFGDPSTTIRTMAPQEMNVLHASTVYIGTDQVVINCDVEGAMITLMNDGEVIGSGVVNGGSVTITFNAINQLDTLEVTATAFNVMPYEGEIEVIGNSVSIIENELLSGLNIYPNPTKDRVTIEFIAGIEANVAISLFNVTGQRVKELASNAVKPGKHIINLQLNDFDAGIYFLKVDDGKNAFTQKLIVTR